MILRILFCPRCCTTNIFYHYLNPVMLVFIRMLLLSPIRWVPVFQVSSHFSPIFQMILFCPNQPPAVHFRVKSNLRWRIPTSNFSVHMSEILGKLTYVWWLSYSPLPPWDLSTWTRAAKALHLRQRVDTILWAATKLHGLFWWESWLK